MIRFFPMSIPLCLCLLLMLACQTAADREAAELRQFLVAEITKFEPLNQQVIDEKQQLYEIDKTSPLADVAETRKRHKAELAELRRRVSEYPNLELKALSEDIQAKLRRRKGDVEAAASARRRVENAAEVRSILQNQRPWRPKVFQAGQQPIEAGKE